ncbi:squalene synthetase-like protein, partial [Teratosphaeriaceae sp. CCFEE 6253]
MGKKGKGKQPQGRAKKRQKNAGYGGGQSAYMPDDSDDEPRKQFKGFAQGTPKGDFSQRGPSVKLRHQVISFVSAGNSAPVEPEALAPMQETMRPRAQNDMQNFLVGDEMEEDNESDVDDSGIQTNIATDAEAEPSAVALGRMHLDSGVLADDLFVIDTMGDPALIARPAPNCKGKKPAARSPSPAASDSSEEVVLFHGRSKATARPAQTSARSKPAASSARPAPSPQPEIARLPSGPAASPSPQPPAPRVPHVTDDLLAALAGTPEPPVAQQSSPAKGWAAQPSKFDKLAEESKGEEWKASPSTPYWRKGKPRPDLNPPARSGGAMEDMPERSTRVMFAEPANGKARVEDIPQVRNGSIQANGSDTMKPKNGKNAADTISALQADWKSVLREKRDSRNGPRDPQPKPDAGTESSEPQSKRRGKRGRKQSNRQLKAADPSDDDDEDAEEAAYDDYMANLVAQIDADESADQAAALKSVLASAGPGPSLVVDGKEILENDTLKHDTEQDWEDEDSDSSQGRIGEDLSELEAMDVPLNLSDLDSSELEDELEYTEREQWEDERDLHQRRQDAMTDEHLARLFAKQQELGIDGDEIVIDDGIFDAMDGVGDIHAARSGLQDMTNSPFAARASPRTKKPRRVKGDVTFPDASALADTVEQYGEHGFDIMDFDRPSLRPTKKGRKGQPPPELDALSDDELRETMLSTWENDRVRKSVKKAEREVLRAEGLLGGSGRQGKADLSQKYAQGMTLAQVQEELAAFLQDAGQTSRPFPPMAKKERAELHGIAGALGLKSK